jgi:hypothetical protein
MTELAGGVGIVAGERISPMDGLALTGLCMASWDGNVKP